MISRTLHTCDISLLTLTAREGGNFVEIILPYLTVSPCISIHYLYMFQKMHLLYYNTNFSVDY
jgi:hypothetical protein